jgi:hypothetical protein
MPQPSLNASAASPKEKVENHNQKDDADAAAAVVAHPWTHVVAAAAKHEKENDQNNKHAGKSSTACSQMVEVPDLLADPLDARCPNVGRVNLNDFSAVGRLASAQTSSDLYRWQSTISVKLKRCNFPHGRLLSNCNFHLLITGPMHSSTSKRNWESASAIQ